MTELADLQSKVVRGAFRVMQSRQFVRLLQDKRVLGFLVDGMGARVRFRAAVRGFGQRVAGVFGLATVRDLRALELDLIHRSAISGVDSGGAPRADLADDASGWRADGAAEAVGAVDRLDS